jgi:hypothetical protein
LNANEGHYVAYSRLNEIWSAYNDDEVMVNVDITRIKDEGYYYCYRRVINDYTSHIKEIAEVNIMEKEC